MYDVGGHSLGVLILSQKKLLYFQKMEDKNI